MAAPDGFDLLTATAVTTTPYSSGTTLLTLAIPARWTVAGADLIASRLDTNAVPLLTLDVGDASDQDRYIAASLVAQTGATEEYRGEPDEYYRYSAASSLLVKVNAAAATGLAGAVSLNVYGYLSADYTSLRKTVLRELGILTEGQTVLSEDDALVQEALEEVHQTLRGRGLATRQDMEWTLSTVPLFASRPYAVMAAWTLASTFGVPPGRTQQLAAKAGEAEREMRRQCATPSSGDPVSLEPHDDDDDFVLDYGALT